VLVVVVTAAVAAALLDALILLPPQLLRFSEKAAIQIVVRTELRLLHLAHEVTMMITMRVVVTEHAAVVHAANAWIQVREAISHYRPVLVPATDSG
jgi:hypothetical protein